MALHCTLYIYAFLSYVIRQDFFGECGRLDDEYLLEEVVLWVPRPRPSCSENSLGISLASSLVIYGLRRDQCDQQKFHQKTFWSFLTEKFLVKTTVEHRAQGDWINIKLFSLFLHFTLLPLHHFTLEMFRFDSVNFLLFLINSSM